MSTDKTPKSAADRTVGFSDYYKKHSAKGKMALRRKAKHVD